RAPVPRQCCRLGNASLCSAAELSPVIVRPGAGKDTQGQDHHEEPSEAHGTYPFLKPSDWWGRHSGLPCCEGRPECLPHQSLSGGAGILACQPDRNACPTSSVAPSEKASGTVG